MLPKNRNDLKAYNLNFRQKWKYVPSNRYIPKRYVSSNRYTFYTFISYKGHQKV